MRRRFNITITAEDNPNPMNRHQRFVGGAEVAQKVALKLSETSTT